MHPIICIIPNPAKLPLRVELAIHDLYLVATPPSVETAILFFQNFHSVSAYRILSNKSPLCEALSLHHLPLPPPIDHFGHGLFLVLDGLIVKGVL